MEVDDIENVLWPLHKNTLFDTEGKNTHFQPRIFNESLQKRLAKH